MKKTASLAVVVCLLVSLFSGMTIVSAAAFSGTGSGTDEDPYVITNAAQFQEILSNKAAVYKIEAEEEIVLDNSFVPITAFEGKLIGVEGKNTIRLEINRTEENAPNQTSAATIFPSVTKNVMIDNLVMEGYVIGGNANFTTSLIGYIDNGANATIRNITNNANITITYDNATPYGAGIIGRIYNSTAGSSGIITLENCINNGDITNNRSQQSYHAGLIGYIGNAGGDKLNILNCRNYGTITGGTGARIGGLIGNCGAELTITNSANLGNVITPAGTTSRAGGIISEVNAGKITMDSCFNAGTIYSNAAAGGLIRDCTTAVLTMTNCFNAGPVINNNTTVANNIPRAAGLTYTAKVGSEFRNCYNVGTIVLPEGTTGVGWGKALVGTGTFTTENLYWHHRGENRQRTAIGFTIRLPF